MARIGPAKPEVIDFVIDLLRAWRLTRYSSAAIRTLFACWKDKKRQRMNLLVFSSKYFERIISDQELGKKYIAHYSQFCSVDSAHFIFTAP